MGKYYQKLLTKNIAPIIWQTRIDKALKQYYSGRGHILMLHRVIPQSKKNRIHNHLSLEISPDHLESIIKYFVKNSYDIISLDQIPDWINNNQKNKRKFVVFTFDDGYSDNLTFAYPLFKKHNVPFTIYVTTSFPDKNAVLWWYKLEDIILANNSVDFTVPGKKTIKHLTNSLFKKESAFNKIRAEIMSYNQEVRDENIRTFFDHYGLSINQNLSNYTLSWDEIKQLSDDRLVIIGAHTLNHYNLCALSASDARKEIAESKKVIETHIQKPVSHFSYPLGKYNQDHVKIIREEGFATATTTKTGNFFPEHLENMYTLPRITINALTTEKVLQLQVNGFFQAITNRFKRIVV